MNAKTILVIDDEKEIAESICEILSSVDGRKIINAATPSEAYMRSVGNKIDLIITDFRMPKTDGADLIKVLRGQKINSRTPVILISAHSEEALEKIGHISDVFVINKPFMADELLKVVEQMLAIPSLGEVPKPMVDAKILSVFISATSEVIKKLTGVEEIQLGKPYLYERKLANLQTDISGLIEMRTFQFQGTIALSFPQNTFLKLVNALTKQTHTQISESNLSHAGEIMRLIYAQAKTQLLQSQVELAAAEPQIISGPQHKFSSYIGQVTMVVPVQTLAGEFFLVVTAS